MLIYIYRNNISICAWISACERDEEDIYGREEIKSEMREEVKSIVINQVIKKVKKSKTLETIVSELEEEEADIKPIYDAVVSSAPDYDINVIKDRLDNM